MSRFSHFLQNRVVGDDGYYLRAADAVEVDKFMRDAKKALKGGFFRKPLSAIPVLLLAQSLYAAYNGQMPLKDAERICQADILKHFGIGISEQGYIYDLAENPKISPRPAHAIRLGAEELSQGLSDFKNEKFESAYSELMKAAELGNPDAQAFIATMLFDGKGTEKQPLYAVYWLTKAAEQGHAEAQACLAEAYLSGKASPLLKKPNYEDAYFWAGVAMNNGASRSSEIDSILLNIMNEAAGNLSKAEILDLNSRSLEASYKYNATQVKIRTFPLRNNKSRNESVIIIECIGCSRQLRVPSGKSGLAKCPDCRQETKIVA